jgi:HAE1 family hydrophobic/amphiphilic exporter-1
MIAATFIGIFMVPVLFVVITRFAYGKEKLLQLERNYQSTGESKE